MKKELSSLEIRQLVNEFQFLVNGRIEKIYQFSKKDFVFKIHITGGSRFLKTNDKFIFISPEKEEAPERPTSFCTILRKHLENKKIKKIWQKGSERVIIFETESVLLIAELYGQTNMVLCDNNYLIIAANRGSRELSKGNKYSFAEKTNAFEMKKPEFASMLKKSAHEIVKVLAGLVGGIYAEEICLRAGIAKNSKASEADAAGLYEKFITLLSEPPALMVVFDKAPFDAVCRELEIYSGKSKVAFSNFYEALDSYLSQASETEKESAAEKKYSGQIEKTEKIIKVQEDAIKKLQSEMEQSQRAGELIYERYQEIEKLKNEMKAAMKNMSLQEISSKLKNKKISIDEKNQKITIEL